MTLIASSPGEAVVKPARRSLAEMALAFFKGKPCPAMHKCVMRVSSDGNLYDVLVGLMEAQQQGTVSTDEIEGLFEQECLTHDEFVQRVKGLILNKEASVANL